MAVVLPWGGSRLEPVIEAAGGYGAGHGVPKVDHLLHRVGGFVGVVGIEELLNVGDDAWKQLEEAQFLAERASRFALGVGRCVEGEGERDGELRLVEVGDVVDEGLLVATVDESEGG